MDEAEERSFEQRLRSLEAAVHDLQEAVRGLEDTLSAREFTGGAVRAGPPEPNTPAVPGDLQSEIAAAVSARPSRSPRPEPHPTTPAPIAALVERGPQYWISRVGIALVLIGVVLVFKYAVDQGWLTPPVRVAFGVALGGILAAVGFRVHLQQRWFSRLMVGGAAAAWYITGFAAYQLLHVVSHPVAFGFVVLVTTFTFLASVREHEPGLAVLGASGGLATPFFLYTDTGTVPGLVAYTCILICGTSAIFFLKGWRSLLYSTFVGTWLVLVLGFRNESLAERVALQTGIIVTWLLFWLVPVVRETLAERFPDRWPRPALGAAGRILGLDEAVFPQRDVAVLSLLTAVFTLFGSRGVWAVGDVFWGYVALTAAAVYGLGAWQLSRQRGVAVLVTAHIITAAVLTAAASALFFEGTTLLVLWSAQAAGMHGLARRLSDRAVRLSTHLFFGVLAIWLLQRTVEGGQPDTAVWNTRALGDALAITAVLASSRLVEQQAVLLYRLAAHVGVLTWTWRELTVLPAGDAIVTATWGVYALAILFLVRGARNVGLVTLCVAVAKLVLFDLSQVEPIWRILLFLSFGGVFLAIGYHFRTLWEDRDGSS